MTPRDLIKQLEALPEEWKDLKLHDWDGDIATIAIDPSHDGRVCGVGGVPSEPNELCIVVMSR